MTKYSGKTVELTLSGLEYFTPTNTTWVQSRFYTNSSTVVVPRGYSSYPATSDASAYFSVSGIDIDIQSSAKTVLTITVPMTYSGSHTQIFGYRFSAKGSGADSNIQISYDETTTITGWQWVNTGVSLGGDTATVMNLNNEGADVATVSLLPQAVKEFVDSADYDSSDYSTSKLQKITYPYRADIPVPYVVKWEYNQDAMRTILAYDTKQIGTANAWTMKYIDVTGYNKHPIYNLLPGTTYYYRISHMMSDGSVVDAKSGSFTTAANKLRLVRIDGTQNCRDVGGWTGLNGKTISYGRLYRGGALGDSSFPELIITGQGKRDMADLKVNAELNLGSDETTTSIAANCAFKKVYYQNYATAITDSTARANFKTIFEWITNCLVGNSADSSLAAVKRNIYAHCQGGCDRTGTLFFLLLGLLGVSESDLAKEYELSSFSEIGFGRLRNTVKATDTYGYSGMVTAIKQYPGSTLTDKFYAFATNGTSDTNPGCGISTSTITSFRTEMGVE